MNAIVSHAVVQCPSQIPATNDQAIQCELIGRMVDTRSIGSGPDLAGNLEIRSAKTDELLSISKEAQAQVNELFDTEEKKQNFRINKFQPPRKMNEILTLEKGRNSQSEQETANEIEMDSLDKSIEDWFNRNEI